MALPAIPSTPEGLQQLLNGPAGKPPAGVEPNFRNPSNLNDALIATLVFCVFLATSAFLLRMYTKIFLIRAVAIEDYIIILAWVAEIGDTIPSGICTRHGCGNHMWDIRLQTFFDMLYWINLSGIVYDPAVLLVKVSILLQYLRIFVPNRIGNMPMFVGIHLCIWSCFILYTVDFTFKIAMCHPREKIWNPLLPGRCFNNNASFLANGIFNVISDFAILILPMPVLWSLQMPLKKKLMTMALFATGLLACVTSILRTYYSWKIYKSQDVSYNVMIMGLWTYAEIAMGITVSCLPVLPKFFRHYGPKFRSSLFSRYRSRQNPEPQWLSQGSAARIRPPIGFPDVHAKHTDGFEDDDDGNSKPTDHYISLDDYESPPAVPPKTYITMEFRNSPLDGIATKRESLERYDKP